VETFEGPILEAGRGGMYVRVPDEVIAALGGKGRIPVLATFDGVPYQGSIMPMGGVRAIGVLKDIRAQLEKGPGDTVTVTLEADTAERTVAVPDDLRDALAAANLTAAFDALSFTRRKDAVRAVEQARRAETRAARIAATVSGLAG
jgi:hypothetical protein